MSISIVTVTYNSSQIILKLVKSIERQNYDRNIEILIIDNNSPDRDELIKKLRQYKSTNNKIRLRIKCRTNNLGFGVSCNYGAGLSKYSNILFLNPDTKLQKDSISILLEHLHNNKADICGGKSFQINMDNIHRTVFNLPTIRTMLFEFSNLGKIFNISGKFYYDQSKMLEDSIVDGVGGAYFLIKKTSFIKLKGFDPNIFMYLEDVDICARAIKLGMKIIYCPHSVITHIGGASSLNKYRIVHKAWLDSREYYSKKHFSIISSNILTLLYKMERVLLEKRIKYKHL